MIDTERLLMGVTEPVTGCTEPAAVALAVSLAASAALARFPDWAGIEAPAENTGADSFTRAAEIEALDLRTTRSMFKNSMAVGLPNTGGQSGILLAAALGAFLRPAGRLNLLKQTDDATLAAAQELIGRGAARLEVDERDEEIFIEAQLIALVEGERHVGEAVIRARHDGLCSLRRDGRQLHEQEVTAAEDALAGDLQQLSHSSIHELIDMARAIAPEVRAHLVHGAAINREAARIGVTKRLGLGVGATLQDLVHRGHLSDSPVTRARIETAAAADARMSGFEVEILASNGSGNQGIMATVPVSVAADHLGAGDDRLAEALALGHLVTAAMTVSAGLLGGMCGCVIKAGVGAAGSIALLLSDEAAAVEGAINNMAGNIIGEICDGAKVGCALKLGTAAGAAMEAAMLAAEGVIVPSTNGIVGKRACDTLDAVGDLARSMREVDRRIVEIMRAKGSGG